MATAEEERRRAYEQRIAAARMATTTAVTGALTDAELRAEPVPVEGPLTNVELRADDLRVRIVNGEEVGSAHATTFVGLTDAELRASPVPVSGPLTDAELRASPVAVSAASLPLPAGAATEATLAAMSAKLPATLGQKVMAASFAVALASDQSVIPVSQSGAWNIGTVTTVTGVTTVTSLTQMNGQAISMGTGVRDAGTQRVTIATNDVVPASQSGAWNIGTVTAVTTVSTVTSLTQMNGQAISMGTGVRDAGTQRVTIATNDVVPVSQSGSWSLAANQSVNVAQMNGVAVTMDSGVTGTGVQRVVLATNVALPAGTNLMGKVGIDQTTPGTTNGVVQTDTVGAATAITALDAVVGAPAGAGTPVSGSSTAGSLVALACVGGESTWFAQIGAGTFTGTLYFEGSVNSTNGTDGNWISLQGVKLGNNECVIANGSSVGTTTNWRGNLAGCKYFRVRLVGSAFTSGPTVTLRLSSGESPALFTPVTTTEINAAATYRGRCATFRTPGLAGTVGQKLFAIHNATGSTKIVRVNKIIVDKYETVVKAVTVAPPIIRIHRVTVLPTNGTAGSKVAKDSALSSNASVTVFQGASADGTASGTALTATIPAGSCLEEEFASRLITAAGYEASDRHTFDFAGDEIVLRALEGVVVFLDYTLATQNPVTDMWVCTCDWDEF